MPTPLDYEPNVKSRQGSPGPTGIPGWIIAGFILLLLFTLYMAVFGP